MRPPMPTVDLSSIFAAEAARLARARKGASVVVQRAAGTLARRLPVQARRDMQDEYNLTTARINAGLDVRRDGSSAIVLIGRKRGIGLIEFGGRWRRGQPDGATARKRNAESPAVYGGTFIATGRNGNRQIFERTTRARLPLRALYGPSIADMLKNAARRERLADFAQTVLVTEINRQLGG